ncbi:hypothetical protein K1719_043786 [Acacia pycnantha]|nr:hypothetical protein K1719_043786 [Acacia pycnantha]
MKIDYLKYKILYKHRSSLLKFVLAIFFFGLAFRLLFLAPDISPILESPLPKKDTILEEPVVLTQDIEEADTVASRISHSQPSQRHVNFKHNIKGGGGVCSLDSLPSPASWESSGFSGYLASSLAAFFPSSALLGSSGFSSIFASSGFVSS